MCLSVGAWAQISVDPSAGKPARNKGKGILLHIALGQHKPYADLADRFGSHSSLGLGLDFMTRKNFVFGLNGDFLFGTKVLEDPVSILRTPEGDLIGSDQTLVDFKLAQRGWLFSGHLGYLIGVRGKRSGILCLVGAGWMQHKIRLQDNTTNFTQISGDYVKGYDRLTGGLAIKQFIGYQHLASRSGLNWFGGFEAVQAYTEPLRSYDFSTMTVPQGSRKDISIGIKLGLTLPFFKEDNPEEIYY